MTLCLVATALLLSTVLLPSATLVGAQAEATGSPRLLAASTTGWVEGESRWISLPWLATEGIQDLRVTASSTASGVEVSYHQETMDHAAPQYGPDLGNNELDVTMLKVSTTTATPESWELEVSASWEYRGRQHEGSSIIEVTTISAVTDTPLQPLVGKATLTATGDGTDNWVDLAYLGLADLTTNVEISVVASPPLHTPANCSPNWRTGTGLSEERSIRRGSGSTLAVLMLDLIRSPSP